MVKSTMVRHPAGEGCRPPASVIVCFGVHMCVTQDDAKSSFPRGVLAGKVHPIAECPGDTNPTSVVGALTIVPMDATAAARSHARSQRNEAQADFCGPKADYYGIRFTSADASTT